MLREAEAVTEQRAFLILWAGREKCLVRATRISSLVVSERFDYVWRKAFRDAQLLDEQGVLSKVCGVKVIGLDWRVLKDGGVISGVLSIVVGLTLLCPLVNIRLQTEPLKKLDVSEVATFLAETLQKNPNAYTHAPVNEISKRLRKAKTVHDMAKQFYRD